MSFPDWAARIAAIGLDAGVETEFLTRAVRERRLPPPEPTDARWPWPLQVRVFGGLSVLRDGLPLGGAGGKAQRKPLELLALLAAHPQGLDAETLIDALWPSLEAEAPRASLEMTVSRLRKWLDLPEAVRVADGRVMLDAQRVWTDVAAFEAAAAAGDVSMMLDLYRSPLLQGERLQGLAAAARERLAARLAAAVLQQTAAWRAAGRQADALALLGRGLAAAPGHPLLQAAQAV
jgi:LuxR family transcriptional regulator, maltose regulon positive regulatory protein